MTSHPIFHHLIGRALTDRRFREALLRSPREAIGEYPFTPQERELIASVRASSLEEFSRQLDERGPALSPSSSLRPGSGPGSGQAPGEAPAARPEVDRRVEGPALSEVEGTDLSARRAA